MKEIRIDVVGFSNVGKTALILALRDFLIDSGCGVHLAPDDINDTHRERVYSNLIRNRATILKNINVTIVEKTKSRVDKSESRQGSHKRRNKVK
jgi:molybdopterin-guanine dinucleotide biosynthesis protein